MLQSKNEAPNFVLMEPEHASVATPHSHVGLRVEALRDGEESWTPYKEIGNYTIVRSSMFEQKEHQYLVPALPDEPLEFFVGEGPKRLKMAEVGPRVIDLREYYGDFADPAISGLRYVFGPRIEANR